MTDTHNCTQLYVVTQTCPFERNTCSSLVFCFLNQSNQIFYQYKNKTLKFVSSGMESLQNNGTWIPTWRTLHRNYIKIQSKFPDNPNANLFPESVSRNLLQKQLHKLRFIQDLFTVPLWAYSHCMTKATYSNICNHFYFVFVLFYNTLYSDPVCLQRHTK